MSSEKENIRAIRKGDEKSLDYLFNRYYDRLFSFACALLKNRDAAEDIVQDVFINVWKNRKNLDENKSILNYLLVSVRNRVGNYLKLKYNNLTEHRDFPEIEDKSSDSNDMMEFEESSVRLRHIVNAMPIQRRKVFMMSRIKNMKVSEIAEEMNLSTKTVERHLYLALKDIRKIWEKSDRELLN